MIIPRNVNPQNVDEYFDDICEELAKNEDKYLVDHNICQINLI